MIGKGYTLDEVLIKVLEDSDKIEHQRQLNRDRQKTYRDKQKDNNPLHNGL